MPHRPSSLFLPLSLLLSCWSAADAASISGTVSDPHGQPVQGARVLVSSALMTVRTAETDVNGTYAIRELAAGSYELRVAAAAFRADPLVVILRDSDTRRVDVALQISAVSEHVVVSASAVDVPAGSTPAAVTVIDRRRIDAEQLHDLAAALRSVTGITTTQSGTAGSLVSVFPRGGESDYTLILIDGIRINAFGGGADLAHLLLGEVERVEVVRGPQSALFGADAMGGVIQIVTLQGGRPRGSALAEFGARDTKHAAGSAAGGIGAFDWGGGIEHLRSDGFTGIAVANGERVSNDDYENTFASGRLGWRAQRGSSVRIDVKSGRNDRGFPGPYGTDPGHTFFGVDRVSRGANRTWLFGVGGAHELSRSVRVGAHIHHTDFDADYTSPFGDSELDTRRTTARLQTDVSTAPWLSMSAGFETHAERVGSTFITDASFQPAPLDRGVLGVFAEARGAVSARASFTAGVRVERLAKERLGTYVRAATTSVNPRAGAAFLIAATTTTWTRLRANGGTGLRAPDAFEVAFTDNPNLKPERSRSLDAGIEQGFRGGAIIAEATGFYNRFDDLIVAVGPPLRGASRFITDNIANARARGVELLIAARAPWGLQVRSTATLLDSEILAVDRVPDVAPEPFRVGDRLLRRPRVQGSVDASYAGSRLTGFVHVGARGRALEVDPSFGASGGLFEAAGYAYVNTGGSVRFGRTAEAFARVSNVLDRAYEEALGYPAPRRSAFVGVRVAAGR